MNTTEQLRARLAELAPSFLELTDDSAAHAGHAGASGGGHYQLVIVAAAFAGKSAVERHRIIYQTLGTLMQGTVHALSIRALSPEEAAQDSRVIKADSANQP